MKLIVIDTSQEIRADYEGVVPLGYPPLRSYRTGTQHLRVRELVERLGGEWEVILICALDAAMLTAEEAARLEEVIQSAEDSARSAWGKWCAEALRAGAGTELPETVRGVLARGRDQT
jgi:hypothetical protein